MEATKKPIQRHNSLKSISREHHEGLLLCWKIRTGFRNTIAIKRIKNYCDWFFEHQLSPHFKIEEKYLFPILGRENELVKKALSEHRRLKRLFENTTDLEKSLNHIEEELEAHIRFEKRILFNEIQNSATKEELKNAEQQHLELNLNQEKLKDWGDVFWEHSKTSATTF
ncbi:MAG: hemerythrin domain-containing protein [Bacteroidia bacterium]